MATLSAPYIESMTATFEVDLRAVEEGIPLARMEEFATASGLPLRDIQDAILPARTLKHRKARNESLSLDESDRFARIVAVYDLAVQVWDEVEQARRWLLSQRRRFNDRTPMEMMRTSLGTDLVKEMLIQIQEGMFA